ncbi:MAG TPA: divalent metal cation transporter [Fimbriimonadaceae bacterium]|nr:divalent metal cation transporter [Fimbriimonadaceae bacterium]
MKQRADDLADLKNAQNKGAVRSPSKPWYKSIGTGLITGAADDDPSGIGTYSQSGASFGLGQLWLVPFCIPLMIAVQEMCGRLAAITGKGIAGVLREHYPLWLLYGSLGLLFAANTLNVYADLNVMAASAKMLFGLPTALWLTLMTATLITLQVAMPYKIYSRALKWLCLSLLAYAFVALGGGVHNDWAQIAYRLVVPSWSMKLPYVLAATAFLGTTISPYLFYWQAGETVEEVVADGNSQGPGEPRKPVKEREIRMIRADTAIGMVASQAIALFIMLATAGTLFASGKRDINTAQEAALALKPLGPASFWLFALGMIGTGFLAVPTLAGSAAYAASETFEWRYGLYRRFSRAKAFYITIAGVVLIGYVLNFFSQVSPIKALIYSAAINCVVAVPLMVVLLLICNNSKIVGKRTNGRASNFFGWTSVVSMGLASSFFLWAVITGHAS